MAFASATGAASRATTADSSIDSFSPVYNVVIVEIIYSPATGMAMTPNARARVARMILEKYMTIFFVGLTSCRRMECVFVNGWIDLVVVDTP